MKPCERRHPQCLASQNWLEPKLNFKFFEVVDLERRPLAMSTQRRGIMKKRRKRKSPLDHAVDWCLAGKDPEHVEVKFVESPPIG